MNELMDVKQICSEYPQFNKQKVYWWLRTGEIQAKKFGTRYFVNRRDLYEFLGVENNKIDKAQEILEENKRLKTELENYKLKLAAIKLMFDKYSKTIKETVSF